MTTVVQASILEVKALAQGVPALIQGVKAPTLGVQAVIDIQQDYHRVASHLVELPRISLILVHEQNEDVRIEIRKQLALRASWRDTEFAFKISVRMAMCDRPEEARPVILAELQQMVDKQVWHVRRPAQAYHSLLDVPQGQIRSFRGIRTN